MKIVHFDEIFHPDFGYQINILPKYQVKMGHDVYIVTGDNIDKHSMFAGFGDISLLDEKDKYYEKETGVHIVRLPTKGIIFSRVIFKRGFIQYVDSMKPDILFCHFNDSLAGIAFTRHTKKATYPIIFDSHMLEMAAENPLRNNFRWWYRNFITPTIIKNKSIVIRTQDDPYVEKCLGIPLSQAPFLSFGADTSIFKPNPEVKKTFREELNISVNSFVIVYTGKLNESKGGKLLAEAFKNKFATNKEIVLIVVGNATGAYGAEVESIFRCSENRIIRYETQKYINLAKFYQLADLSIFPRHCSLSFYDAQACGLPVLSEDNNINIDRVSHGNGLNFKSGDCNDLRQKIVEIAEMDNGAYKKMAENSVNLVTKNYDYKVIAEQYTALLIKEMERFLAKQPKNL